MMLVTETAVQVSGRSGGYVLCAYFNINTNEAVEVYVEQIFEYRTKQRCVQCAFLLHSFLCAEHQESPHS